MIELDTIYNEDCLTGMQRIPDGSVDCIICDLPYGTMKGAMLKGWDEERTAWDEIIPTDKLFEQYERVLRMNGAAILFSQEPYTNHLRSYKHKNTNIGFAYPMIWKKNCFGNNLMANKAPVSFFEDLSVFFKRFDTTGNHPLRDYSKAVMEYCGATSCKQINERLGHRQAEHFFYVDSTQFALCTEKTYNELIEVYGIDKMKGFKSYEELVELDKRFGRTFNLPEGQGYFGNVLEYAKDKGGVHPTQKPVALIQQLIRTYTNEGDTILDNTIGSGTTAVAALREKRHFIGFELNRDYYDIALRRIKLEQQQQTLF